MAGRNRFIIPICVLLLLCAIAAIVVPLVLLLKPDADDKGMLKTLCPHNFGTRIFARLRFSVGQSLWLACNTKRKRVWDDLFNKWIIVSMWALWTLLKQGQWHYLRPKVHNKSSVIDKTRQDKSLFKPEGQSPYGQKYIIIYMRSGEQLHNIIMYRVITCFITTWYK